MLTICDHVPVYVSAFDEAEALVRLGEAIDAFLGHLTEAEWREVAGLYPTRRWKPGAVKLQGDDFELAVAA